LLHAPRQWHLKQAVKKNPNIITEKVIRQVDTLIIRDSVKVEHTFTTKSIDTIIIDNEHFKSAMYTAITILFEWLTHLKATRYESRKRW
jgi:hypothetical protein